MGRTDGADAVPGPARARAGRLSIGLPEFPIAGIDDGVVRIRLIADADLESLAAASRDPDIVRWTRVPEANTGELVRQWLAETREAGEEVPLVVVGADDGTLLGSIAIQRIDLHHARCQLGYWLAAEARGCGHMTRAIRLLTRWIFDSLPIDRVGIHVEPGNQASRALAERAGFTLEGVLRSFYVNKGRRRDAAIYSVIRNERREAGE